MGRTLSIGDESGAAPQQMIAPINQGIQSGRLKIRLQGPLSGESSQFLRDVSLATAEVRSRQVYIHSVILYSEVLEVERLQPSKLQIAAIVAFICWCGARVLSETGFATCAAHSYLDRFSNKTSWRATD